MPTATVTNTPQPTATVTNTPLPTATVTNTPQPTATVTNTLLPTATVTNTPQPTATVTNTPQPTATVTNTPQPTATVTNTPQPTATATNTPLPTATVTNTPQPTATATNTPLPTATNTPIPTQTNTPRPTPTNTLIPTPTTAVGQVTLTEPINGDGGGGQRFFRWEANFTPGAGTAFELVFWPPETNPLVDGFGLAAPTTENSVYVDLDALDDLLGSRLDNGVYQWGVLLVRTDPYERIAYLGGGNTFTFTRSSGGSNDSGSGGPSSGE
ncbi:MAG: hypothetical protein R2932_58000 [Caldilineaceae bacterium]